MLKYLSKLICYIFLGMLPYYKALGKNNIYPTLYLANIKSDSSIDELFVEIIEHNQRPSLSTKKRIPAFPRFWDMRRINEIKDLPLWSSSLRTGEPMNLQIIFKDQDFWSKDGFIGSIKIALYFNGNTIKSDWIIIDSHHSTAEISSNNSEHMQKIKLTSLKATYILNIGISTTKNFK